MSGRRRIKKRKSRKKLVYGVIAVTFILLFFLTYFFLYQLNKTSDGNVTSPRVQAAIVDHLNFTGQSNATFVNTCINILKSGGLTWNYCKGEDVTVDFYRNLPSYGNSLIILRVHSAIMKVNDTTPVHILGLFTSELYSPEAAQKYPTDVNDNRLVEAFFSEEERAQGISYFGIVPRFVERSMNGNFNKTIIIMMGCEGLGYINASTGTRVAYTDMAEAFINKGAKVYIGWDGPVAVKHTDQATVCLLQHLISEKQSVGTAIEETMAEVGRDPTFNSALQYHPKTIDVENYAVPNLGSCLSMNVVYTSPASMPSKRFEYTARR